MPQVKWRQLAEQEVIQTVKHMWINQCNVGYSKTCPPGNTILSYPHQSVKHLLVCVAKTRKAPGCHGSSVHAAGNLPDERYKRQRRIQRTQNTIPVTLHSLALSMPKRTSIYSDATALKEVFQNWWPGDLHCETCLMGYVCKRGSDVSRHETFHNLNTGQTAQSTNVCSGYMSA